MAFLSTPLLALGLPGLPLSVSGIVSLLLKGIATWVATGAGALVEGLGSVLTSTTEPPLGAHFSEELTVVAQLGAALVPILLVVAAIEAIVRQDLSLLLRAMLLRAPVALLCSGAAVEAVVLGMRATDALSRSVLAISGEPASRFVDLLSSSLISPAGSLGAGGFEALLFAVLLAAVALLLWLELAVRGAAIAVALLFVPLALAGVVFPATSHWVRRLGETLFAVVLSKLVIACVLSLAVSSIGAPQGPSGFVEGVALLLLAALSPFTLLRLLPMLEAGAVGHLEGIGHRGLRGARRALGAVPLPGSLDPLSEVAAISVPELGYMPGQRFGGPGFDAEVERISGDLFGGAELGEPASDEPEQAADADA